MSKPSASNFVQGNAGQTYIRNHIQQLLAGGFVEYERDTSGDFVEGGDSKIVYHRFGKEVDMAEYSLDGVVDVAGIGHEIGETIVGGLEVKTISNFTFRSNDNNEPSGTIPFELWHTEERTQPGWLLALLNPKVRLVSDDVQPIHAVRPVLFCFLLVSYLGPYACVMFEDFPVLAQRLNALADEEGFQVTPQTDDNNGIPFGNDAQNWHKDDPYIIGNCWHIPFCRLSDLATVTLIGGQPLPKRSIQLNDTDEYVELQQRRYEYLRLCAGDRKALPTEAQSEIDFYSTDESHIYADVRHNMKTIDKLSPKEYPYLFQALKSFGMRSHLNSILYNMYSHEYPTTINDRFICFYQAKKYLRDWSREGGIVGSTFSWQSHIIFLTDVDLLKKYVDNSNPVQQKVYRSVPRYTDVVLGAAERKAKAYIDAGINLNNFTKAEVIKVSGQERADYLYYGDGRIISGMREEVDAEFISAANRLFDEKGIRLPEEIVSVVRTAIMGKYWIDPFEENHDSEHERKHIQANQELARLKNRYGELAKEVPCQFRELTKEEKVIWGLSLRSRKKYFVK